MWFKWVLLGFLGMSCLGYIINALGEANITLSDRRQYLACAVVDGLFVLGTLYYF